MSAAKPRATPGKFIALEGGEGAGKSTQAALLAEALRARGLEVVLTREPGGTPGAEAIRALLLNTDGEGWGPRAEALLFAAARADHVERLIRPALADGKWVICDRFVDSSRAYQGGGGGLSDADILALHGVGSGEGGSGEGGSGGLLPDVTLLIEVSPEVAATRAAAIAAANGSPGVAMGFVEERLGAVHQLMQQILGEGDASLALRGRLSAEVGARPARERLAAVLELARAVLATELREAAPARQACIIAAHADLTRLSAQAPTYNFDPGLLAMEIGALLAGAAMPRETAY